MARIAAALGTLRMQIITRVPKAPKAEFGWLASASHHAQNPSSDHEQDARGIVHALDIPHCPQLGLDTYDLYEHFRQTKDARIKYCISNRKIFGDEAYARRNGREAWTNYPYHGANPHNHHMHVSVNKATEDDSHEWDVGLIGSDSPQAKADAPAPAARPLLKRGMEGDEVRWLQSLLMLDGDFGSVTEAAVMRFQMEQGVEPDGVVGTYTWALLEKLAKARGVPLFGEAPVAVPVLPVPPVVVLPSPLPSPVPIPVPVPVPGAVADAMRARMAHEIVNFEARRDAHGRLAVYDLPAGDGGGRYEVAGINEKYHKEEVDHLVELIKAGKHDQAEKEVAEYLAKYTDAADKWHTDPGVRFYLRDCIFNRGPKGAMRILQRACQVPDDGEWGPRTEAAVKALSAAQLLPRMREARESYERAVAHRDESSKFWKGLVNRWDKALTLAKGFDQTKGSANA
jgi:peptidoglycan hydrolase-like protein with peptidoglycan-binding domain